MKKIRPGDLVSEFVYVDPPLFCVDPPLINLFSVYCWQKEYN